MEYQRRIIAVAPTASPPATITTDEIQLPSASGYSVHVFSTSGTVTGTLQILASNDNNDIPSSRQFATLTDYSISFSCNASTPNNNGAIINAAWPNYEYIKLSLTSVSGSGTLKVVVNVREGT